MRQFLTFLAWKLGITNPIQNKLQKKRTCPIFRRILVARVSPAPGPVEIL
jgi:hypothetical protein